MEKFTIADFLKPAYTMKDYRDCVRFEAGDMYPSDKEGMARVWIEHITEHYPTEVGGLSVLGISLDKDCFSETDLRCYLADLSGAEDEAADEFITDATDLAMFVSAKDPFFNCDYDTTRMVIESYYWFARKCIQGGADSSEYHLDDHAVFLMKLRADLSVGCWDLI